MEHAYEIVNTDLVQVKVTITATIQEWNGLRLGLPANDAYCNALKGVVEKMLGDNQLTVTSA